MSANISIIVIINTVDSRDIRQIMLLIVVTATTLTARGQSFTVKTNAAYAATGTPNIKAEMRVNDKWTTQLTFGYNPFTGSDNSKKRHLLLMPEMRYWPCQSFNGQFIGINAAYLHFNAGKVKFPFGLYPSLRDERRQGDAVMAGASWGYAWILSPRWTLEASGGADIGYTWYDRYSCRKCGMHRGCDSKLFAMPRVELNIVYIIR